MTSFLCKIALFVLLAVSGVPASASAQGGGSAVPWMMVPAPVQQTIRQNVGEGNRVQKVLVGKEDGAKIYLAMIMTSDGTFAMVKVASNGSLLGVVSNEEKDKNAKAEEGPKFEIMKYGDIRKMAEDGDAEAQFWIGKLLAEGKVGSSSKRNFSSAILWYRKSALQGNVHGQDALGRLLIDGRGAPQDYREGYFWRALAARTEAERSDARSAVKEFLGPRQMYKVDKVLPVWKPGNDFPLRHED